VGTDLWRINSWLRNRNKIRLAAQALARRTCVLTRIFRQAGRLTDATHRKHFSFTGAQNQLNPSKSLNRLSHDHSTFSYRIYFKH
jgi:hypothetical protein